MTVHLHMGVREGEYAHYGYPLPPFITIRPPELTDANMLVFGVYIKKPHQDYVGTAVAATVVFAPEQTLDERKALVEHAIDLCDLVHRARSTT